MRNFDILPSQGMISVDLYMSEPRGIVYIERAVTPARGWRPPVIATRCGSVVSLPQFVGPLRCDILAESKRPPVPVSHAAELPVGDLSFTYIVHCFIKVLS